MWYWSSKLLFGVSCVQPAPGVWKTSGTCPRSMPASTCALHSTLPATLLPRHYTTKDLGIVTSKSQMETSRAWLHTKSWRQPDTWPRGKYRCRPRLIDITRVRVTCRGSAARMRSGHGEHNSGIREIRDELLVVCEGGPPGGHCLRNLAVKTSVTASGR